MRLGCVFGGCPEVEVAVGVAGGESVAVGAVGEGGDVAGVGVEGGGLGALGAAAGEVPDGDLADAADGEVSGVGCQATCSILAG